MAARDLVYGRGTTFERHLKNIKFIKTYRSILGSIPLILQIFYLSSYGLFHFFVKIIVKTLLEPVTS